MELSITVRGLEKGEGERSAAIRNYLLDKFAHVFTLLEHEQEPIYVDIVVTVLSPHPHHHVEIRIAEPRYRLIINKEDPELYRAINELMDIVFQKINNHKNELIETARHEGYVQKVRDRIIR